MPELETKKITHAPVTAGTYVLMRTPMNVPIADGVVQNQFRITRALATINWLVGKGARVILVGHIGDGSASTQPIAALLTQYLPVVHHCPEVTGSVALKMRDELQDGDVLVLENVRSDPREKKNDPDFARALADLGEVFINDAFADSHRSHASIVGVPQFLPSYVGMNFMHECTELMKMREPARPALFLLGGAKFDTKLPLVEQLLGAYDHVFIGGALANDFFKAKGYEVGRSLTSQIDLTGSPLLTHEKVLLPIDVTVTDGTTTRVCAPTDVAAGETIYDMGPASIAQLEPLIAAASAILWNGPFGNYEAGFEEFTMKTAELIAAARAYAVVGGGDTAASIESLGCQERYAFLSTAGGAMLTFLEHGTLVGIDAIVQ